MITGDNVGAKVGISDGAEVSGTCVGRVVLGACVGLGVGLLEGLEVKGSPVGLVDG